MPAKSLTLLLAPSPPAFYLRGSHCPHGTENTLRKPTDPSVPCQPLFPRKAVLYLQLAIKKGGRGRKAYGRVAVSLLCRLRSMWCACSAKLTRVSQCSLSKQNHHNLDNCFYAEARTLHKTDFHSSSSREPALPTAFGGTHWAATTAVPAPGRKYVSGY